MPRSCEEQGVRRLSRRGARRDRETPPAGHGAVRRGQLAPLAELLPALDKLDARASRRAQGRSRASGETAARRRQVPRSRRTRACGDSGAQPMSAIISTIRSRSASPTSRAAPTSASPGRPAGRSAAAANRRACSRASKDLSWASPGFAQSDDHPVVCVSWQDAKAYADWLSRQTGEHYRLPTQQEWLHRRAGDRRRDPVAAAAISATDRATTATRTPRPSAAFRRRASASTMSSATSRSGPPTAPNRQRRRMPRARDPRPVVARRARPGKSGARRHSAPTSATRRPAFVCCARFPSIMRDPRIPSASALPHSCDLSTSSATC